MSSVGAGKSHRVLLVEDDEALAFLESDVLERRGFSVETVPLGRLALERLEHGGWDLMVLDYKLPDMTGAEVLARMEAAGGTVPVVVVTGYPDPEVEKKMRAAGVLDYLIKDTDLQFLEDLPSAALVAVAGSAK